MNSVSPSVPFFRPDMTEEEVRAVTEVLASGWLTTGPRTRAFEERFRENVGAKHALAVNSCTAALHLAVDALGLRAGDGVLVPTMTFAATAEVVRYLGAIPILVDCDPDTLQMSLKDAAAKVEDLKSGRLPAAIPANTRVVGMMVVHVGGAMLDLEPVASMCKERGWWMVEDAAHAFPAARRTSSGSWVRCGENTADVTCFSFYANKTITTGEGGMAVTARAELAERMRLMALHGLSHDAWTRYAGGKSWDYRIVAPGYKYNLTDIAAALGLQQLARAETMRARREGIAERFLDAFSEQRWFELPQTSEDQIHAWHLFPIRLRLERLSVDRNTFLDRMRDRGVVCSVHWRPLHLHPYYQDTFGWQPHHMEVATRAFDRIVSLPLFSAMRPDEVEHVIATTLSVAKDSSR